MTWIDLKIGQIALIAGPYDYVLVQKTTTYDCTILDPGDNPSSIIIGFTWYSMNPDAPIKDWFEDEDLIKEGWDAVANAMEQEIKSRCTCDLYAQLLPYGCKCGGK